jgi:hypothetical protein
VLAAIVATPWASDNVVPGVLAQAVPIPVALGVGWLLGPLAASGDRWTAGGTALAAAILGTITGAFVVAGVSAPLWTDNVPQAIAYTLWVGALGVVFFGIQALIVALPVTSVWAFLTRATTRAWRDRHEAAVESEAGTTPRQRVPAKLRRRRGRGVAHTDLNPAS